MIIANSINLLTATILILRALGRKTSEQILGIVVVLFGIPLLLIFVMNITGEKEWWSYILVLPAILYLIIELVFDYILKIKFRTTKLHGLYISIYYLALFGLIGYSFAAAKLYGVITLVTYFINLGITGYLLTSKKYRDKMYG